jgi:hypothetical protein
MGHYEELEADARGTCRHGSRREIQGDDGEAGRPPRPVDGLAIDPLEPRDCGLQPRRHLFRRQDQYFGLWRHRHCLRRNDGYPGRWLLLRPGHRQCNLARPRGPPGRGCLRDGIHGHRLHVCLRHPDCASGKSLPRAPLPRRGSDAHDPSLCQVLHRHHPSRRPLDVQLPHAQHAAAL